MVLFIIINGVFSFFNNDLYEDLCLILLFVIVNNNLFIFLFIKFFKRDKFCL